MALEPRPVSRRAQCFLWIVRLAAVVTVVVFAAAGWRLVRGGELGWTDARRDGVWYVATVATGGPADGRLEPGDRLVALDGDPYVQDFGTGNYRRELSTGDTYRLTVARGDTERIATLPVVRPTPGLTATRLSWFLVSLTWCVIGLFMGLVRPERPMARLAFFAAMAVGFVFVQVSLLRVPALYQPLHVVIGYHFFYRFPGDAPRGRIWTTLLWLLYAGAVFPIAIGLTMSGITVTQGTAAHLRWMGVHRSLFDLRLIMGTLVFDLSVAGMIAVLLRNYRLLRTPDRRRRIRWVVYFSMLGLLPEVWWGIIATAGRPDAIGPIQGLAINAATCAIPISVAYAVVRHRLFDIRVVVRRGIQYLLARRLLQLLLALPIAAVVYTILANRDRTIGELLTGNALNFLSIGALAVSVRFRDPVRLWLDRRFFREQYDSEQLLIGLVDDLGDAGSIGDASRLVRVQIERALHPKSLHWWQRDTDGAFTLPPVLVSTLERRADPVDTAELTRLAPPAGADSSVFENLGVHLVVPVTGSDGRLAGALMLGEKQSEEPYGQNDRRLLHTVAKQIAVVWEKLRLQAQVGEEQRIRHEVFARVDAGLARLLKECPSCGRCHNPDRERCDVDGTTLTWSLPVERTLDAKYRLDRLIGKGGMGAVYEARDLRLGRVVAVKIMTGGGLGDEAGLRRFQREARAAASLNHPRIVTVFDYGTLPGRGAFLVMERLHGMTMRSVISRAGTIAPAEAAAWFDQVLEGVAAAHRQGIIHRDLKPENVMADSSDGGLAVKVLDFGVAKIEPLPAATTATLTAGGAVVGTFGYMSPEQLVGSAVDARSDLFAIGVMVAEALTGTRPFAGDGYAPVLHAISDETYHLPGDSAEIAALDALLQRCLAKDPRDRIASADALRRELVPALRACAPVTAGRQAGSVRRKSSG